MTGVRKAVSAKYSAPRLSAPKNNEAALRPTMFLVQADPVPPAERHQNRPWPGWIGARPPAPHCRLVVTDEIAEWRRGVGLQARQSGGDFMLARQGVLVADAGRRPYIPDVALYVGDESVSDAFDYHVS